MISNFLAFGFVIGIRHALDADHVAAVMSLATRGGTIASQARQGALWGLGHTLTLLLAGGACILFGFAIPEAAESWLEAAVGAMLVVLGVSVFARLRRVRVHAHGRLPLQAWCVGAVHGLAGSAALVLLVAQSARTPMLGLLCIAAFGLGSILGMSALAAAIAMPLEASARMRGRLHGILCGSAGAFSVLLGAKMLWTFAS
ncbi:MAG: urease accessory protein [Planctomycetota bacterium]